MTPAEAGAYFAAPFDVSQSVARVSPLPPVRKPAEPAAPKLRCVLCGRTAVRGRCPACGSYLVAA